MGRIRSGADVRKERERRRLSREKLASLVGVSTATLRRWEIGAVEPSPLALRGIERAFVGLRAVPRPANAVSKLIDTLVLSHKILVTEGLVGPFGHASVRSARGDTFFVARHEPADIVEIKDIIEVGIDVTTDEVRSRNLYREIFLHSCLYRENPAIRAVVHTHSPYAVALGTMKMPRNRVLPTTNPGANLGTFIPIFHEVGLVQTPEKAVRISKALQGQNGILLRGHGALVVGVSLEQAVLRAIYLELEARAQIISRNAGEPIFYQPHEANTFRHTRLIQHAWRHYEEKAQAQRA
jgi:HCOMODA/2-hydroxy-3-carboxy-muconic semialdehyde decarboxylase